MARASKKLSAVLLVPYTALLVFNLMCGVGIITAGKDAPADQTGYWKFANYFAVLGCFLADAYLVSIIVSSRRLNKAILLVPYTALLVFNLMCGVGIITAGKDAPADQTGYWKFANFFAVLGCILADAYLISIIVSSRRLNKAMEGQLPPPPPQMDIC